MATVNVLLIMYIIIAVIAGIILYDVWGWWRQWMGDGWQGDFWINGVLNGVWARIVCVYVLKFMVNDNDGIVWYGVVTPIVHFECHCFSVAMLILNTRRMRPSDTHAYHLTWTWWKNIHFFTLCIRLCSTDWPTISHTHYTCTDVMRTYPYLINTHGMWANGISF